ncbi:MAG: hypothetical protein COB67_00740 [SAR324 cluster bacterium]|uniref:Cytochrome c domain-containing protein n=1 Tax=SAR324 cluster bacterium TaxID=2024889 RepID=A0A2A4TBH5_9DELT|nr:MAG: hypothetical protein COB67_00740 [SAR324 cluster bacterium]
MAKETNQVLNHNYDGIEEYDNPLPPWWKMLFYITIIWGVGYLAYYHVLEIGDLQDAEYVTEMELAEEALQAQMANESSEGSTPAVPTVVLTGDDALAAGKNIWDKPGQCTSCHGANGEGMIGPNLTDAFWLNGDGSLDSVVEIVTVGVPAKGMIPWAGTLRPEEIKYVSSYVLSLKGSNPDNARPPQGKKF